MRTSYDLSDWQHYLSHPEIDVIKHATKYMSMDSDVLCIGAGAGTCAFAVLEELENVLYYSVDILTDSREVTTNEHLRLQETPYYESGKVIRIWGDSHIVGKRWRIPLDMLIIDGGHGKEDIEEDLRLWVPHVKVDGFVICHDYSSNDWPWVKTTVDKYVENINKPEVRMKFIKHDDTMISFRMLNGVSW